MFVAGAGDEGLTPAEIRDRTRARLRQALYDDEPHVAIEEVEGAEPNWIYDPAGAFRYVLGRHRIDRRDLHAQETIWAIVERFLDEAIGDPTCVFGDDGRMT